MKLDPCPACNQTLKYISEVDTEPIHTIVLWCGGCDRTYHLDKPDDWHTPGQNFSAIKAREQGTSYVRDIRPEDEVKQIVADISSIDPTKIDEKVLSNIAARITLKTMLYNLASKRPTVRQAAARELARVIWKPARTDIDITSAGNAILTKSAAELIADTQSVLARLEELNQDANLLTEEEDES